MGSGFAVARSARRKASQMNPKREPREDARFRKGWDTMGVFCLFGSALSLCSDAQIYSQNAKVKFPRI